MSRSTTKLPESKLLKALADLQKAAGGDVLQDADPEGGLAAEGTPLSDQAPKGTTKKSSRASSRSSSSESSSDDESDVAKTLFGSSSSSSVSPPPKKKDKKSSKKEKVVKAARASSSSGDESSDDESSDDGSSDDKSSEAPAEKSFRAEAERDKTMRKAIEVSSFLSAFVDRLSDTLQVVAQDITKALKVDIREMEARINARIDNRVAKGASLQNEFNGRLAKAVTAIGNIVQDEVVEVVKSLSNSPVSAPRGKAILSKAEVNSPPWNGAGVSNGSEGGDVAELAELPSEMIGDWLFKKAALNQIDPKLIMAWEADHYSIATLPNEVQKSIANDLCK